MTTRGDVERGEQRSGAVANVIVGAPLGHTRHHREHRLLAVERLDLAFLIHAQDERTVWRRQVEPNDVADLVDELRVGGQLEGLGPVRLEGERAPDATDGGMRQAGILRHRTDRPVRRVARLLAERALDHIGHAFVLDAARPARARLIDETVEPVLREPAAPLAHGVLVDAELGRHCLAGQSVRAAQNDPAALRHGPPHLSTPRLPLQILSLFGAQHQRRSRPASARHRSLPLPHERESMNRTSVPGD